MHLWSVVQEVLRLTKFRQFQGFSESFTNRSCVCCRLLLKDVPVVLSPVFKCYTMLWSGKAGDTFDLGCVALIGDCGLGIARTISLSVISSQTENTAYRLLISHPHTSTTNLNLSISLIIIFLFLTHSLCLSVLITVSRSLSFCSEANLNLMAVLLYPDGPQCTWSHEFVWETLLSSLSEL